MSDKPSVGGILFFMGGKHIIKGEKLSNSRLYKTWLGIRTRCFNPNAENYGRYGGVGITMCNGFNSFLKFKNTIGEKPSPNHSVDRIDNSLHYSCGGCSECTKNKWPMNVKWSTFSEQRINSSFVNMIEFNGEVMCLKDWADRLGIKRSTLSNRINTYGWSIERSLNEKIRKK